MKCCNTRSVHCDSCVPLPHQFPTSRIKQNDQSKFDQTCPSRRSSGKSKIEQHTSNASSPNYKWKALENLIKSDHICGEWNRLNFWSGIQRAGGIRLFFLRNDMEMPALEWSRHSKKTHNTRLKSNRLIWNHELSWPFLFFFERDMLTTKKCRDWLGVQERLNLKTCCETRDAGSGNDNVTSAQQLLTAE